MIKAILEGAALPQILPTEAEIRAADLEKEDAERKRRALLVIISSSSGSKTGAWPWFMDATFCGSASTPTTCIPFAARQAAKGDPSFPRPITEARMVASVISKNLLLAFYGRLGWYRCYAQVPA